MSLTVIQRHREIGLLRSLFTRGQVRTMITKESVALSASAVIFGNLLGLLYGTLGAQSLVGVQTTGIVWGLPCAALAAIAVAGLVLVLVASQGPARRAAPWLLSRPSESTRDAPTWHAPAGPARGRRAAPRTAAAGVSRA